MSDIVERLRSGSICSDIHDTGSCCRVMEARSGCECAEAADEIERLRAGLFDCMQEAANHHRENEMRAKMGGSDMAQRKAKAIVARSGVLLHNIKAIARAALEEKHD